MVALAALGTANLDALLDRQNVGGPRGPRQSQAFAEGWFEAEFDGLALKSVKADGRAAKMGLLVGDVLTQVEGEEIESLRQIFQYAREATGAEVRFTWKRGDQTIDVRAPKGELPQRPARPTTRPGDTVPAPGGVVR